jgi:putative membrane protein
VTREDNAPSQGIRRGGDANLAASKALKGAAFDRVWIDHEVACHECVLDALDKTLIPGAHNEELLVLSGFSERGAGK